MFKIRLKKEIFESIQEENDKSKRENNLILHNVDESEKELGKSRENDDTKMEHKRRIMR